MPSKHLKFAVLLAVVGLVAMLISRRIDGTSQLKYETEYKSDSLPAPAVSIRLAGPEELVLSADAPHCAETDEWGKRMDVPDAPLRAVRWRDEILAVAAHYNNLAYYTRSLKNLERRDCHSLLKSRKDPNPCAFADHEWLISLYISDDRLFGLIHNEYWGGLYDRECRERLGKRVPWASVCLYVNLTGAVSEDGRQFIRKGIVAAYPYPFSSDMKRNGVRDPTNLFRNPKDNHVYFLAWVDPYNDQKGGKCLFRSKDPFSDPWLVWDGKGFNHSMGSPCEGEKHKRVLCQPVSGLGITTVVYYEPSQTFIGLVFDERISPGGIFYRTSPDLIHWSRAEFLMEGHDFKHWKKRGAEAPIIFPSLIDPESRSANFDMIGDHPYLYFMRARVKDGVALGRKRDILRRPLVILPLKP